MGSSVSPLYQQLLQQRPQARSEGGQTVSLPYSSILKPPPDAQEERSNSPSPGQPTPTSLGTLMSLPGHGAHKTALENLSLGLQEQGFLPLSPPWGHPSPPAHSRLFRQHQA